MHTESSSKSFGGTTCGIFTSDIFLVFLKNNCIYLFTLSMLGLHCCVGFSLALASRGSSLVALRGLLAVASLGAQALGHVGFLVVAPML